MPSQKKRSTLCISRSAATRPKSLEVEDYETRDREVDGDSSAASSSDEEMQITGRARILQRRGCVLAREPAKLIGSVPAEARHLSALEVKCVTRKTLEVCANSATGAACRQAAMWRYWRWTGFSCKRHRAEKLLECFFQLSRRRIDLSRASGLSKGEKRRRRASQDGRSQAVWSALAVEMCRVGGMLAAVVTQFMVEALLRQGDMLSLKPLSFLAPKVRGVRSWVTLLLPQTGSARTGEADDTIGLDSERCLWMEPAFERPLLGLSCAEYLVLFRRAAACLQIDMVPHEDRHSGASVDGAENTRTLESVQKRERWVSAKYVRRYEKSGRVKQTWSQLAPQDQAHCELCNNFVPSFLLHGHASPTLLQLLRLWCSTFSVQAPTCNVSS